MWFLEIREDPFTKSAEHVHNVSYDQSVWILAGDTVFQLDSTCLTLGLHFSPNRTKEKYEVFKNEADELTHAALSYSTGFK